MTYPAVVDEAATLSALCAGHSIARYGDGEFNLARGHGIPCQRVSDPLRDRLAGILRDSGECLVGIPNLHSDTPKSAFWQKYSDTNDLLSDRTYYSSFISRPDSAPWIDSAAYWCALESLWAGKAVTLVHSDSWKSLQREDLTSALSVREVFGPTTNAFEYYDDILACIGNPDGPVLLCLGPTATVLTVDLCTKGVHAIDMGHVGIFLRKHRRGEPMPLTPAEKARDF